jgi:hypothetical protein
LLEFVKVHLQAIECQQFIGGEGRNRTESSPTIGLKYPDCEENSTLILQGFQALFITIRQLSDLSRHIPISYPVIEEIIEGFVEVFQGRFMNEDVAIVEVNLTLSQDTLGKAGNPCEDRQ